MRRPVSSGMRYAPNERRALGAKRRPAMKKISTVQTFSNEILKEQKLTVGLDLGDRWSFYCVLDEAGKIILEQKVATTPEAMKQTFGKIPRSLIALETGTHSPSHAPRSLHGLTESTAGWPKGNASRFLARSGSAESC